MKLGLWGVLALVLSGLPVQAQAPLTEDKLKGVLETLRQLNKAPTSPSPGKAVRSAKPPPPSVSPEIIKQIGDASIEFLQKYAEGHVIYGGDNRRSYINATAFEQRAAEATAVFVAAHQVSADRKGTVKLANAGGGHLCSPGELRPGQLPEPFWDQPRPGLCSGFKIGPDLVATAGHCIKPDIELKPGERGCADLRVVFGFRNARSGAGADREIAETNVYRCVDVLAGQLNTEDWRIIRVHRTIDAPQVTMRLEGRPPLGQRLTVVGHPIGLPVTISDGATVQLHRPTVFSADLDTYGGNSGSPVFNSDRLRTGELFVEGILVSGETDFVQHAPCQLSKRCPKFSACGGENVTYSSLLEPAMRRLMRTEASKQ